MNPVAAGSGLASGFGFSDAAFAFIPLVVLLSLRVGVMLAAMPAPFGSLAPVRVRVALGLLIAVALSLPHAAMANALPIEPLALMRLAIPEMLVGLIIGTTVRVTLAGAQIAGTAIGFSSGLAFANSVDPTFGESVPPTSRALSSFAVVLFFTLGGHHAALEALTQSITIAPPGNAFVAVAHEGVLNIGSQMMTQGLRIASPVVATMFIVQLGMALVSRAAPRVQIFSLTFAVAVSAGLLTLLVAMPSIAPAIAADIHRLPEDLSAALGAR
ncbi:MAG: flagellar biosynthetic protein FliR [Deltaproteobacteria bacterium]|nr:flagellar biosynthetic protein FliR [Deltaproteobacteria bacterium]